VGTTNLPGTMPVHASTVLANNIFALLDTLIRSAEAGEASDDQAAAGPTLHIDLDDEIHVGALITHRGAVVNDLVKSALEPETAA
jgi:NAD/NADP transhydrogenase alpha subunit